MSSIKDEAILRCAPEMAFREFADPGFPHRIGFGSGTEVEVLYRDARFIHFRTTVERNGGVHCLESERILAPESLTIVTLRRNLGAFRYNVIVDCFTPHASGTRLTHVDEFQPVVETVATEAALRGMKDSTALFMDKIRGHFASAAPATSAKAG